MKAKIDINPSAKHEGKGGSVSVTSDALSFTFDDAAIAATVADAAAEAVRAGIRSIPEQTADGKRRLFNRTGRLAREIKANPDGTVTAPPGYLEDEKLAQRLADVVPALREPLKEKPVQAAIAKAGDDIVDVQKAR